MQTLYQGAVARSISDIGAAILALVFIYAFAVVFTLYCRPLYYAYVAATGWPESVGMSMSEIADNYEALIWYNSIFASGPLEFPTLDLSADGRVHYEEVKRIFVAFQIALIASYACLAPLATVKLLRGRTKFLKVGAAGAIISAAAILSYLGLDWGRFFVRFHETFFSNDYWIFDPVLDPSILILPNGYFLMCAVMIFALIFGLSVVALLVSRRYARRAASACCSGGACRSGGFWPYRRARRKGSDA
jgi:integral membrane protein (TIGR01906 family)